MKTLYLTQSSDNIVVDPVEDFVGKLNREDNYMIRSVYYIEEPMHVVYQYGEEKEEIDAKKGDILLVFYSDRFNLYHLDTIKTKQWAANIRNRHKLEQAEKEKWAEEKKQNVGTESGPCCCDCDCACPDLRPTEPAIKAEKKNKFKSIVNKITNKLKRKG